MTAPSENEEDQPSVTVYPDGPLILRGGIVVKDVNGVVLSSGQVVALCRCGRSATKPFCDSSHKRGVLDSGQAQNLSSK
ncbi:MAG: CDGSH iron-sulfur domain-containing protein [Actinomycetota bacterium]|nr:CDGSH iron-sulfur domain-containing protein [Actinomycetota bacterium]